MASLRDRTFDRHAWIRLAMVMGVLGLIAGGVYASTVVHHEFVQKPRMMSRRFREAVGTPGMATTQITNMGSEVVPMLLDDVRPDKPLMERQKSLEILSAIDDPRVLPVLVMALNESDIGMQLAGLSGMARRGKPDAFDALWRLRNDDSDLLRYRMYVALGLVASKEQLPTMLDAADSMSGKDRNLLYWAVGHTLRRIAAVKRHEYARPSAAPLPEADKDERKLGADIRELKRKIAAREGKREELAVELARLTSVQFTTWNYNKLIAQQTIAISGPGAIRGMARIDVDPKPPAHYEPLRLERKKRSFDD